MKDVKHGLFWSCGYDVFAVNTFINIEAQHGKGMLEWRECHRYDPFYGGGLLPCVVITIDTTKRKQAACQWEIV